jgi:hypothetical protein
LAYYFNSIGIREGKRLRRTGTRGRPEVERTMQSDDSVRTFEGAEQEKAFPECDVFEIKEGGSGCCNRHTDR